MKVLLLMLFCTNLSEKIPSAACKTAKSNTISVMVSWSNKRSGFGTGLLEQDNKLIVQKNNNAFFIYSSLSNNKRCPAFSSLIFPLAKTNFPFTKVCVTRDLKL